MEKIMADKRIILTGGGTAGHVTPNIALIPYLQAAGYEIAYIGSYDFIESTLIPDMGIKYVGVSTGMLRRYRTLKNLSDPFKVFKGISEAKKFIKEFKPNIVFSKGGYVGVPVTYAAFLSGVPTIIHESDMTPGLANKLCLPIVKKVCCNFPETLKLLPKKKAYLTGSPIRDELLKGDKEKGLTRCGFKKNNPIIMVIGGSLGSASINEAVRGALPTLLNDFNIVHICGKGKTDESLNNKEGYCQFEYVKEGLNDLYAMADLIISRAGANSICEILALKKPNLLIPLSKASRGDQILNANSFKAQGYSMVLDDDDCNPENLIEKVTELYFLRQTYIDAMEKSTLTDSIKTIIELINRTAK